MGKRERNQWHPAFYGALHLELAANKHDLEFAEEYILNTLPLRVDALIIKKKNDCIIQNEIGNIFRAHNLIEYKSPNDSLNYNTFLKGIAYVYLYKSREKHIDEIPLEEITLSFIRRRKPQKLLAKLNKENFMIEEYRSGIYYVVKEGYFPIQIIVTKELSEKSHVWVNSLTSGLSQRQAEELIHITNGLTESDDKYYADSVWEIVVRQNLETICKLREDEDMCKAMAELFKPEIDAAFNNGFNNGVDKGVNQKGIQVFKNMINRGLSREDAQAMAEISDALVEKAFAEM